MLNLNFNINKAIGGNGDCIGVLKYNYSASILVVGGGGGGATGIPRIIPDTYRAGGGGGGGAVYNDDISIVPNVTYTVVVGSGGVGGGGIGSASFGVNGQSSSFFGYDDLFNNQLNIIAGGGFGGEYGNGTIGGVGGNSGNLIINNIIVSASKTGGTGGASQGGAGGGASLLANGGAGDAANGGNGGVAVSSSMFALPSSSFGGGGGGGAKTPLGAAGFPNPVGDSQSAGFGGGVGGPDGNQSGDNARKYGGGGGGGASADSGGGYATGGNGYDGIVAIKYAGEPKAIVTNATTITEGGYTTHIFNPGTGSFLYTIPYPWPDVVPYQVIECPPQRGVPFIPSPRFDPFSASLVLAVPGNIFTAGYVPVFNQKSEWDDISAYIKSSSFNYETNTYSTPFANHTMTVTGSSSSPGFVTQSYDETLFSGSGYLTSIHATGYKCVEVSNDSNPTEGTNLSSDKNFVIEAWVAYEQTASLLDDSGSLSSSGSWGLPSKTLAIKQGSSIDFPSLPASPYTTSSYWVMPGWGGQKYIGIGEYASGSSWFGWFPFERNLSAGASIVPGTISSQWTTKQWIHWAVSNTYTGSQSTIRLYANGVLVGSGSAGTWNPSNSISASLFILGSPQTIFPYTPTSAGGAYATGSGWYIQDFRMYNGTNKNYTGSQFTPPESMIIGTKEPYPVVNGI